MRQVARNETMRRDFHIDSQISTRFQPALQNVRRYICFSRFRQFRHNRHGRKRTMPEWVFSNGMWSQIFAVGVPVAEKILRPVMVYAFLASTGIAPWNEGWGQSLPHTMRSGAASTRAFAIGATSSYGYGWAEIRYAPESFTQQLPSRASAKRAVNPGCASPSFAGMCPM